MKVIAVLPAYNEEKRIKNIIIKTKRYVDKIIVVDDGSKDKTTEISKQSGAEVIRYEKNQGVGYATRVGLKRAISLKPDTIIFLDADGQHDPKYIPQFIKAIEDGADYVCGWRDLSNYPPSRKIGNWGLRFLTNLLCYTGIKDTECGYRAMTLNAAKKIKLRGKRYEKDGEFAYEVWRNKLKVSQVKITVPFFHPKGAVIRGFKNFFYLLRRRFNLIKP
jgi:glycosyltransferase involved in cell wall biosynthesis